jgi:hypothetical protein
VRKLLIAGLMTMCASAQTVRVTVYDRVERPRRDREEMLIALSRIFHLSGLSIEVADGDSSAYEASVTMYSAKPDVGREHEALCLARRDIALDIVGVAPPGLKRGILGMSNPVARVGLNVRVFEDRVLDEAHSRLKPHLTVLAYVIAHEIGHVLLRPSEHRIRGLMMARWGEVEFERIGQQSLLFTRDEVELMRSTLAGKGCRGADDLTRPAAGSMQPVTLH